MAGAPFMELVSPSSRSPSGRFPPRPARGVAFVSLPPFMRSLVAAVRHHSFPNGDHSSQTCDPAIVAVCSGSVAVPQARVARNQRRFSEDIFPVSPPSASPPSSPKCFTPPSQPRGLLGRASTQRRGRWAAVTAAGVALALAAVLCVMLQGRPHALATTADGDMPGTVPSTNPQPWKWTYRVGFQRSIAY